MKKVSKVIEKVLESFEEPNLGSRIARRIIAIAIIKKLEEEGFLLIKKEVINNFDPLPHDYQLDN